MSDRTVEQMVREINELHEQVGRLIHERAYFRGQAKKWHEKHRLLENRLRKLRGHLPPVTDWYSQEINAIVKALPNFPRAKWGQRAEGRAQSYGRKS